MSELRTWQHLLGEQRGAEPPAEVSWPHTLSTSRGRRRGRTRTSRGRCLTELRGDTAQCHRGPRRGGGRTAGPRAGRGGQGRWVGLQRGWLWGWRGAGGSYRRIGGSGSRTCDSAARGWSCGEASPLGSRLRLCSATRGRGAGGSEGGVTKAEGREEST